MNKDIKLAIKELTKVEGEIITLEQFEYLEMLPNVYWIDNGSSGLHVNYTWYSFYVVEDDVAYNDCETNYIECFDIYL